MGKSMDKNEFLEKLRLSLNGKIAPETVNSTLNYYDEYISTEMREGKTEAEVMEALGDPRLIARTIAETKGGQLNGQSAGTVEEPEQRFDGSSEVQSGHAVPGWVWLVGLIVVLVLIVSFVFKLLSVFWPVLAVLAVVLFLVKLFRDWL